MAWIACKIRACRDIRTAFTCSYDCLPLLKRSFVSSSLLLSETNPSMVLSPFRCTSKSIPKTWAVSVTGEGTLLETSVRLNVRLCEKAKFNSGVS